MLVILFVNLLLGGMSVNYCLSSFMGKTVDFWVATLAGLFLAEITIPLAIVCWLLRLCGVETPFIR